MPTIAQMRAARALLDWSQSDLADKAGLSQTGIARIENGTNQPNSSTLEKIGAAFDAADVEFIDDSGVKKRTDEIITLKGVEGLKRLVDDIYATSKAIYKKTGENENLVYLYNAKPENWHKWLGKDWWDQHGERMKKIGPHVQNIFTKEGETYLISSSFSKHKLFPAKLFNDQSIYAYGNKLAFVTFGDDNISIKILENREFCEGFRALFSIAWDKIGKDMS